MTNLLVASFKWEDEAVAAFKKMRELEQQGDVVIFEHVIIRKNEDGLVEVMGFDSTEGLRTISGMAIGSIIGALAGPVGLIYGMVTGTIAGAIAEGDYFNFSNDLGEKIVNYIPPGSVAIVAEVEEYETSLLDDSLGLLGATIIRSDIEYAHERHYEDQLEAIEEEIANESSRIKTATESAKVEIQNTVATLKEDRRKVIKEIEQKVKSVMSKSHSKLESLGNEIRDAFVEHKVHRLRNRIEKYELKLAELKHELARFELQQSENQSEYTD